MTGRGVCYYVVEYDCVVGSICNEILLRTSHGLLLTSAFYWDQNDATRACSKRFFDRMKRKPTMVEAGVYGAIMHYLAAIKTTGTTDGPTVVKQMKATPVNDFMTKNGKIREDGRLVRDMYLFEVKKPENPKAPGTTTGRSQ